MQHRRDIDGLRAIAVLPVMLFHAGIPGFSGGFLGVDVFFVISGYLITGIIVEERDQGRFSLLRFYDRRARRILPALLVSVLLSSAAATVLMVPGQLREFGQSVVASILFSANVFFWLKLDYWSQSSEFIPLIHFWSLGVEEQFYLVTPFLVLLARTRWTMTAAMATLAVASFGAMLAAQHQGQVGAAFYLLPFRAWEIAAGALAVLLARRATDVLRGRLLSVGALIALLAGYVLLDARTDPALLHGVPVACTVLLLLFGNTGPVAAFLGQRLLVIVGLLSYSLYLFHQPVLALARLAAARGLSATESFACMALTLALAACCYRWVEVPCRRPSQGLVVPVRSGIAACAVLVLAFGLVLHRSEGLREQKLARMDGRFRAVLQSYEAEKAKRFIVWRQRLAHSGEPFLDNGTRKVLFAGDSMAEDLYVTASLAHGERPFVQLRRLAIEEDCFRTEGKSGAGKELPTCREELDRFRASPLVRDADVVVLANAWLGDASLLATVLMEPELRGKRVVVYEAHGFLDMLSVLATLDRFAFDTQSTALKKFVYRNRHQRTLIANETLQRISKQMGVETVNSFGFFCQDAAAECSVFDPLGRPLLIDSAHLSMAGYELFGQWLNEHLISNIAVSPRG